MSDYPGHSLFLPNDLLKINPLRCYFVYENLINGSLKQKSRLKLEPAFLMVVELSMAKSCIDFDK